MISGVSLDYNTALFWRRIAAIGWSTLYSILLHFILALSMGEEILKKKSLYLIYLPSIVCILVFSIIKYTVEREFHLMLTDFGWANKSVFSFWDTFFYIYYLTYSAAILLILFLWGARNNKEVKRQALKISLTFIVAIIFGTFFELILNRLLITKIPSTAHLFIVIPIACLFYEIRGNHVMAQSEESKQTRTGLILSDFEQLRFYQYLGGLFLTISLLYMFVQTVIFSNHYSSVQFSLALFLTGSVIFFLPRFVANTQNRDNIMIITVNVAILMMIYFLSGKGIFHIVWTFPIPIIFISILYIKRQLLYSVAAVSILGNIWLMVVSNDSFYSVNFLLFLPKILFFTITAYIASYIHRVYLNRLNENEIQIEYQEMISLISSRLVSLSEENKKECLESILADLGIFSMAQESFLICYGSDNKTVETIYCWGKDQNLSDWNIPADFSEYKSGQLLNQIMNTNHIIIDNMDLLPPDLNWIKEMLNPSVKSLIALGEVREGRIHGILGLNFSKPASVTHVQEIKQLLSIPSNLVGDGLLKLDHEQKNKLHGFL